MRQRSLAWRLTSRRPRCCTNPTLQEPERRISWLMETSWTLFWNSPTSEALYQVMDALTMKYRGGWPRLVHLSADYARDSGTTTMCPCGLKARYTMQSCCPPSYTEPRHGQCTYDRWKSCMPSWTKWQTRKYSNGQGCHLWKIFWSERISGGLDTSWGCHQTGYQSRFSTPNCLLVRQREGALVSGSRIPSRETWSWET